MSTDEALITTGIPEAADQQRTTLRRNIITSIVGQALEWYDFFLYGTAAALIFGKLFFPIGLFVGMSHLFVFGVGLAVGGVIAALALRLPIPPDYQAWPVMQRIERIRTTGKVPYGVVMAAAALVAMFLRYWPG